MMRITRTQQNYLFRVDRRDIDQRKQSTHHSADLVAIGHRAPIQAWREGMAADRVKAKTEPKTWPVNLHWALVNHTFCKR